VSIYEIEFLKFNGDKEWLKGIQYVPRKLQRLSDINKYLAHQPWLIDPNQIEVNNRNNTLLQQFFVFPLSLEKFMGKNVFQ